METKVRRVHLRPRLMAAARMIGRAHTVADIGCDHGRLAVALLQSGAAERVIAADISEASLEKARSLARHVGVHGRMDFRLADGFTALLPNEAQAVAVCGMGGQLIARMLSAARPALMGAGLAVLQPMRGVEELRRFLFEGGYRVVEDTLVADAGRIYQVFSVSPGQDELPAGWPKNFFLLGHRSVRDPFFLPMAERMLCQAQKSLLAAQKTPGEAALAQEADALEQVIRLAKGELL